MRSCAKVALFYIQVLLYYLFKVNVSDRSDTCINNLSVSSHVYNLSLIELR